MTGERDARRDRRAVAGYAALALVPLLLTAPGRVAADTKAYLYLDPGRLLSRAAWLWEPDLALGTVTHQNIGYLFPLGPYYWILDSLGVPDWIAQRVLLAGILLAAGWGVLWLMRQLHVTGGAPIVAGLVYLLSPYVLPYFGRTSALLLPWAALPWLVGLTARSLRLGGWRSPALFAIVLTLVGGTNASSLVFIGIGPALFVPFAVWGGREVSLPDAARALGRLAVLTVPTQLWWMAGLRIQGAYGLPILELTESVDTVAQTSTAAEVVRQLGYWYFYGRDGVAQWTYAARYHTQRLWVIVVSFALPALAALAAVSLRWRYRAYFVALLVVGVILGVGTHPYADPPPLGAAVKSATQESASALALRNSPRAVPLISLAVAALLAAGLSALSTYTRTRWPDRRSLVGVTAMVVVAAVAVLNAPALLAGRMLSPDLLYDEDLPDHWSAAAAWLDARDDGSRVLELPGSDFGAYRWGETQDPVTPGLLDRGWVGRELTAFGTPGSADLIRALDRRIQEGVFEPQAVAPIARLMGVGDVLFRFDTQYERYRGPRPRQLWLAVGDGVDGLGRPVAFGAPFANLPDHGTPLVDDLTIAGADLDDPPALVAFPVLDAQPIVRASAATPLLVDGDGEGLIDLAASGLLDPDRPVFYAAGVDDELRADLLARGGPLVVTDTNRKRAQRWGTIRENNGYTEQIDEVALVDDPEDARLVVFPDAPPGSETVAELSGGIASVQATAYGNIVAYASERRPVLAIDGDQRTSWQVGGFSDVIGERLRIDLDGPIATDRITVQQLPGGNRFIATVGVLLDGEHVRSETLDERSRQAPGQEIVFDDRTFSRVELVIEHSNVEGPISFNEFSNVGFVEVGIADRRAEELIRPPTVLFDAVGDDLASRDVVVVLTRLRADPGEPFRDDPETRLSRVIDLPVEMTWTVGGTARIEARAAGEVIDAVVGRDGVAAGFAELTGGEHLAGDIASRASSALDADPGTAWTPRMGPQLDRGFTVRAPSPTTVERLDVVLVDDAVHSVARQLRLTPDGGEAMLVDLAPETGEIVDGRIALSVELPAALTFTELRVDIAAVDQRTTREYFSGNDLVLPVGIAELGIEGLTVAPPTEIDSRCRRDLVFLDGRPFGIRLSERVDGGYDIEGCGPMTTGPGEHVLTTADALAGGIAIDRLILTHPSPTPLTPPPAQLAVRAERTHRLEYRAEPAGPPVDPYWLVVGQSLSPGWKATAAGVDLGEPVLIDGYANGWWIDPVVVGEGDVVIRWTPQRLVWQALAVSAVALVATVVIAVAPRRIVPHPFDAPLARLRTPLAGDPRPLGLGRALVAATAVGAAAWLVAGPLAGLVVAAAAAISATAPRARSALTIWPVVSLGLTAAWYVARQVRFDYPMGVEWPAAFDPAHDWVLVGILMLGADLVLEEVRARSR